MFSSKNRSTQLTCGFKVNTKSPDWHKSMTMILKKITGGEFVLDVDEGMAYVSGRGDPNKLLKLMGSKKGKAAEMAFVRTGGHHRAPSYNNSYWPTVLVYWPPYYSPAPAMQPYHHQYPYPGYNNHGYY